MIVWAALGLLCLRLALGQSIPESGAQGPGGDRLHRQHWPRQLPGPLCCCLSAPREAPAICGCGRPTDHCP
ncbi:von Willebrand factor A domain-containing protein 1 isoform X2 [Petaurus breviceps papuanus]|uniref:von Willebrand factor A domain-containing protein 1 isoform X2 n=1 Tax=Petaurus breviceps papuanus TaxID=3040969 RepID=UPI0036D94490